MHKKLFLLMVLVFAAFIPTRATKVVELKAVDKDYLMIYFKDGEVFYKDDGTGPSAYSGHDYAPGDDRLVAFGEPLNVDQAVKLTSWSIKSTDDPAYHTALHPVEVYRKAKVNNTDINWNYKLDHWFYLKLPASLQQGKHYTLQIDPKINADKNEAEMSFDIFSSQSEAIHVNLMGYHPNSPVKAADLYLWLGDGGPRDYKSFENNKVWLYDQKKEKKHQVGQVSFWQPIGDHEAEGRNLTGSPVWNIDFNFNKPGTYRLVVDGVGCSRPFEIKEDIYFEPYKTSLRGYYYMRIGQDAMDMKPIPRRPLFIPGKDPAGFTVYITDLDPFDPAWDTHPGDTWDEPHFKPAKESMFWQRRLEGNPVNPNAYGGHSDALDWDRHLAHVSNIYDLLLPYYLTQGQLGQDDLNISESGNGIPDIIDEARNETDLWLRLRHGEAYAHGLTNPTSEKTIMFQAGTTTMAAWANAANCAMLGDCFRISGHDQLMAHYRNEAIKAFNFADRQEEKQLDDNQDIGDASMRGRDFKMMAAAFLYNLTGDTEWEDIMAAESVVKNKTTKIDNGREWVQTWGTMAYLMSPHIINYKTLQENMKWSVLHQARENNLRHMTRRPSRRSSNNNYWQTPHNLQMVLLAHALSDNPEEKEKMIKAMVLESDWGLGRNPSNIVEMTGLGSRNIVNCYTSGRNDGFASLHPGHTPYNNLDPWGTQHNGSNPRWFSDRGYPDWDEGGWPHQEAHFNCRYSWANGEFTPRQTMRGKMALYGYLHAIFSPKTQKIN
ncbi:MAG: glycoside hydrolase family 9 protein [Candidatus Cyclobacteriaceae bacterium M3_2C_046]